ncbi:competence type IV pilus major pilin ComGC [Domibacillus enclensis]|nr:competence type IV pilus major pilin ComGC [Domibacillus enclensis]
MMKKYIQNERGFTLIEMMIVLLVITVLLFIAIPNVAKQSKNINAKGCDAFVHMVQGQVQAYRIDTGSTPSTIQELVTGEYLRDDETACPGGGTISIDAEGVVSAGGA